MTYRYSGRKEYSFQLVNEAQVSAKGGRLRVLLLCKEGESEHFCNILIANVQSWGYEVVHITAAMMRNPQNWQEIKGDILVYDLDALLQYTDVLGNKEAELASSLGIDLVALNPNWPKVRLSIVLSNSSVSRPTLERLGAAALLHKPFDTRTLERYLRVFQRLLYAEAEPDKGQSELSRSGQMEGNGEEKEGLQRQVARILIADDQQDVTNGIRQCLMEQGNQRYHYEVREVHDGLALLEQCLIWKPHCVVTDLLMPWLNGYQVMRCMANSTTQARPVFVVISALMQHEFPMASAYLRDQVVCYVEKPFDVEDLLHAIEQGLSQAIEPGLQGARG